MVCMISIEYDKFKYGFWTGLVLMLILFLAVIDFEKEKFKTLEVSFKHISNTITQTQESYQELVEYRNRMENGIKVIEMEVTAYSNDPISINVPAWRDGCTSQMILARKGIVAADWTLLPPGTVLFIPGYGKAVVADKGAAIKGSRLDLFFPSYDDAILWGRRKVNVTVIKYPI